MGGPLSLYFRERVLGMGGTLIRRPHDIVYISWLIFSLSLLKGWGEIESSSYGSVVPLMKLLLDVWLVQEQSNYDSSSSTFSRYV